MKFVDQTKIYVKSGPGGGGCMSFRREAFVEFGGPNGGDGGRGGHVIFEAVGNLNTLVDFRYKRHFKAKTGVHGMGSNRTGKTGQDMVLKVPAGTQIFDENEDFMLADLASVGDRIILLEGGHGGLGNAHFKSSTNQAPRRTTPGGEAEEMNIVLRLKLLADAGLVGLPNAGKSTFLSVVSAAKPKIADYPFTTLAPQLGVVGHRDHEFVLADIPGIIEGASEGIGLGTRFLGHVERCGVLLHLIDGTQDDVVGAYETIMSELEAYDQGLTDKKMVIGLNKMDALEDDELAQKIKALKKASGAEVLALSAVTHEGKVEVLESLWQVVQKDIIARELARERVEEGLPETPDEEPVDEEWSPV